jgi:hypothetical protein
MDLTIVLMGLGFLALFLAPFIWISLSKRKEAKKTGKE